MNRTSLNEIGISFGRCPSEVIGITVVEIVLLSAYVSRKWLKTASYDQSEHVTAVVKSSVSELPSTR